MQDIFIGQEPEAAGYERGRNEAYDVIGAAEYRGNTVSFIYDKMLARGVQIDQCLAKIASLEAKLQIAVEALEFCASDDCYDAWVEHDDDGTGSAKAIVDHHGRRRAKEALAALQQEASDKMKDGKVHE